MTAIARTDKDRATEFAAAVRERLSDLPPEELDELLDGLQADLAERLADGGELGDADAYAEELRQAAGLPERGPAPKPKRRPVRETLAERARALAMRARAFWGATPARRWLRDFVLVLRPLWWVARGLGLAWALITIVPGLLGMWWLDVYAVNFASLGWLAYVLLFVVLSVQWGRGRWAPNRWLVWLRRVASVIAVIALIPAFAILSGRLAQPQYLSYGPVYEPGLWSGEVQIGNIFAYDCNGQPLQGVQLFTREGQPLTTLMDDVPPGYSDEQTGEFLRYQPSEFATQANGWGGWNVFPLRQVPEAYFDEHAAPSGRIQTAPPPFEQVPAISDQCPSPEAGAAAGESGGATGDSGAQDPAAEDPAARSESGTGDTSGQ